MWPEEKQKKNNNRVNKYYSTQNVYRGYLKVVEIRA